MSSASLVWQSNNLYETQFVEAACIKSLAHCNVRSGDIDVNPAISTLVSNIAISHRSKRTGSNNGHLQDSFYVSPLVTKVSTPVSIPVSTTTTSRHTAVPLTSLPVSMSTQPPPSASNTPPAPQPSANQIDISSSDPTTASPISIVSPSQATSHIPAIVSHSPSTIGTRVLQPPLPQRFSRFTLSTPVRSNSFLSQIASYAVQSPGPPVTVTSVSQPIHRLLTSDQHISSDSPLRTRAHQYPRLSQ